MRRSPNVKATVIQKSIALLIYCAVVFTIALFAYRRPHYNWDILAYMALAMQQDETDITQLHQHTYRAARDNLPPLDYEHLVSGDYRKGLEENPASFFQTLPFYAVKPLYIKMVYLLHKAGFSLPMSTVIPSVLFYLAIGFLLFYWLSKYVQFFWACAASILIMGSDFMVFMARLSTPDCLSAFLLLCAFYFLIERSSLTGVFSFLILAIFARLDNIVPALFILAFLFFIPNGQKLKTRQSVLVMAIIIIGCYFCITMIMMKPFDWNAFYYPTFARQMDLSHTTRSSFSIKSYVDLVISQLATALVFYRFVFSLLFLWLIFYPSLRISRFTTEQAFSALLFLVIACRFVLYPDLSDRFNIAYYLFFLIVVVKRYAALAANFQPRQSFTKPND